MRYKVVPRPRSVAFLRETREALPLVPGTVEDCCARIRDQTDVPARDEAREYLTFLQALGLVAESERGYYRTRADIEEADLPERFQESVFGARELLSALGDGALTADEAFEALRESVPRWERARSRSEEWESEWRDRTERLLEWAAVFGLVERVEGDDSGTRYRRVDGDGASGGQSA